MTKKSITTSWSPASVISYERTDILILRIGICAVRGGEDVAFTSPECEFAAGDFLIDFERDIVDHRAWFAAYSVTVVHKIFRAECLDCE